MSAASEASVPVPDGIDLRLLCGPGDSNLRAVEGLLDVRLGLRDGHVLVDGDPADVSTATSLVSDLLKMAAQRQAPTSADVERSVAVLRSSEFAPESLREDVLLVYRGRPIRPKTVGQKRYCDAIREHTVTFGIGPAGTGKTYLAMAMAMAALERKEVGRIVLTRPVVEAGENLGFLPGSVNEKVDPYVRPLYDALYDMTDPEKGNALVEQGAIEIAPLAFMRGRTFNDAFLILDEAQNTTPEQMKMFLTRLGFGSKMVVTGDATQLDLPHGVSGLRGAEEILGDVEDIAFCRFDNGDVVRHSLVARIVDAYERHDAAAGETVR